MWLSVTIYALSLFSAVWLWLGLSYVSTEVGFHELGSVNPSDLGVMVASISVPILIAVLTMILAYNHMYLKKLFSNQQAFIKLLQKKSDMAERIEEQKLDLLQLEKANKLEANLLVDIANVVIGVGVLQKDEVQKMWQTFAHGNKNAFVNVLSEASSGGAISARIEAKIIQDDSFADRIIEICNAYDTICNILMRYDREQILYHQFTNSAVADFVSIVSAYKKMEQNLINQRMQDYEMNPIDITIGDEEEDDEITSTEPNFGIKKNNNNDDDDDLNDKGDGINWKDERNELIDKYRMFADNIKTNLKRGVLDEK